MIAVVTTYNIEIFKLFYTHVHNQFLLENLYLYVDKEDSSEFKKIVDLNKTKIFDKNDFKNFYGEKYLESLTTFSKIYFINMLLKMNLINDSFYFTDDDVLFFNDSFKNVASCDKAVYARDMLLIIDRTYANWPKMNEWIKANFKDNLYTCATNFFFPQFMLSNFSKEFTKAFDEYIQILYDDRQYIEELNNKSRSKRNAAFPIFYLDTPFFNVVFPRLGMYNYKLAQIYLCSYSHFRKVKNSLHTEDTGKILDKYYSNKAIYPEKQPLYHYSVGNKLPLMRDSYNYFNNHEYVCKNINDILNENPKERNKIIKEKQIAKTKALF